VTEQFS